jgi:hypothetical protein
MDQLFKALPRDLQWEVLAEFVGTHVVRNGKLMRKMTGEIQAKLLDTMPMSFGMQPIKLCIKSKPIQMNGNICHPNTNLCVRSFTTLRGPVFRLLNFGENLYTEELFYLYISNISGSDDRIKIITLMDNSIILPPFIKHDYPSYPYTDKKQGISLKKVVLYNPTKPNTCYHGVQNNI